MPLALPLRSPAQTQRVPQCSLHGAHGWQILLQQGTAQSHLLTVGPQRTSCQCLWRPGQALCQSLWQWLQWRLGLRGPATGGTPPLCPWSLSLQGRQSPGCQGAAGPQWRQHRAWCQGCHSQPAHCHSLAAHPLLSSQSPPCLPPLATAGAASPAAPILSLSLGGTLRRRLARPVQASAAQGSPLWLQRAARRELPQH